MERGTFGDSMARVGRLLARAVMGPSEPLASHGDHFVTPRNVGQVEHDLGHLVMTGKMTPEDAMDQLNLFYEDLIYGTGPDTEAQS